MADNMNRGPKTAPTLLSTRGRMESVIESPSEAGFLYLKPYKTGSSTCMIDTDRQKRRSSTTVPTLRSAEPKGLDTGPWKPCIEIVGTRSLERSFLWV
jgi:hypothetical protein